MAKQVKKKWVRLRRFLQKLKVINPNVGTGDGGLMTDDMLNRHNKPQTDSTHVIKDTVVVKPMN
jgi:hypothetical protein